MMFDELETVVLTRDIPEHALKADDLGAVVGVYPPDGIEVEFVTAGGETRGVLTLRTSDIRKVGPQDMVAVRPVQPAA